MQSPHIVELNEQNFRQVLEGSMQTPCTHPFLGTNEPRERPSHS